MFYHTGISVDAKPFSERYIGNVNVIFTTPIPKTYKELTSIQEHEREEPHIHRGFNHFDEPPDSEIARRRRSGIYF